MKFLEYLQQQRDITLTDESKKLIYQRFLAKKRQWLWLSRMRTYARVGTLSLLVVAVFGLFYFSSYGPQDLWERELNDGFIWFQQQKNTQVTYADEIGTIIETIWEVQIYNQGVQKQSQDLVNNDKVLLLDWAELTFSVQEWVQAKIIWPAEFELEKTGETYVINMLSWEYVQIKSVQIPQQEAIADRQPNLTQEESEPVQLVVKTTEFEISSSNQDWDIDMTISAQDGKQVVENTGVDVLITKVIQNEEVVTELKTKQTAAINGEVTVVDMIVADPQLALNDEQAQELAASLKEDLTISYKIEDTTDTVSTDTWVWSPQAAVVDMPTPDEQTPDPVEPEIEPDGKRVIWWADLQSLQAATNASLLMRDIRNITVFYAHGNPSAASVWLNNLANSLWPASGNILGGMHLDRTSPWALANSIQALINNLESKWFVPPVYINKLKGAVAWLRIIETIPAGSVDNGCNFDCIVNDVLQVPASQRGYLML